MVNRALVFGFVMCLHLNCTVFRTDGQKEGKGSMLRVCEEMCCVDVSLFNGSLEIKSSRLDSLALAAHQCWLLYFIRYEFSIEPIQVFILGVILSTV